MNATANCSSIGCALVFKCMHCFIELNNYGELSIDYYEVAC